MEQNNALMGQEEELENEQTEVETASEEADQSASESMEELLEDEGLELDFPKQGEIRSGIIATISEGEVLVSVGTKSEGVLSGRELELIPDEERDAFEVGKEIPVYVVTPEDPNGNVVLSYVRAREEKDWQDVGGMLESGDIVESEIIGFNKGGLLVPIGNLRGFVPTSQVSLLRRMSASGDTPEQRWGQMIEEPIKVCIIEVDRDRRRLILSERLALQETRESLKDRLLDELQVGDVRSGRVTSLADFGAFVNIEGADGLVHLSEISWDRIQYPSEVLEVGQEVDVKVISIDRERKRIGLSMRQLQEDPWVKQVEHLQDGMLVEGTITHLTKFGAFARIGDELEGLIHVSELSEQRIAHPKEVVHEGDEVTLRVIKIDPERHRIGLSLRKVDSPAYADLDWKMALAQEVGRTQEDEPVDEIRTILIEADESAEELLVVNETADAEVEDLPEVESEPSPEEAEAEVESEEEQALEDAEVEEGEIEEQEPEAEADEEDEPGEVVDETPEPSDEEVQQDTDSVEAEAEVETEEEEALEDAEVEEGEIKEQEPEAEVDEEDEPGDVVEETPEPSEDEVEQDVDSVEAEAEVETEEEEALEDAELEEGEIKEQEPEAEADEEDEPGDVVEETPEPSEDEVEQDTVSVEADAEVETEEEEALEDAELEEGEIEEQEPEPEAEADEENESSDADENTEGEA